MSDICHVTVLQEKRSAALHFLWAIGFEIDEDADEARADYGRVTLQGRLCRSEWPQAKKIPGVISITDVIEPEPHGTD